MNTVSDSRTKIQLSFPKLVEWTWKNTDCKRRPDALIFVAGFVDSERLQTSLFMNDPCYFSLLHTKAHPLASTLQTIAEENHDNLQYFLMRSTVTRCSPFQMKTYLSLKKYKRWLHITNVLMSYPSTCTLQQYKTRFWILLVSIGKHGYIKQQST